MTAYSYPLCHGVPTVLRCLGWYCVGCGQYLPFRDEDGLTYAERQQALRKETAEEKRVAKKKSVR